MDLNDLHSDLKRIDSKLDKLIAYTHEQAKQTASQQSDIDWLKGFVKTGFSTFSALLGGLALWIFKHLGIGGQ